jgi:magnesium transporter
MAYFTKHYHPPGTAPGTLRPRAAERRVPPRIHLIDYDAEQLEERDDVTAEDCRASMSLPTVTWIHIQGDPDLEVLTEIGAMLELHPLALEDVVNTGQRPKVDLFESQFFVVLNRPVIDDEDSHMEQASLFMGEGFVVSFHSGASDCFEPVRKRLRTRGGRIRDRGADYLLYALLDMVIDEGFPVLESFGERIEALEDELLDSPERDTLNEIHNVKRELLLLRRMLWPQREVLNVLMRDDSPLIQRETRVYLRDCYDHTVQIMDLLETYRDMTASMLDVYLSSVSNRLNEVMRVLTVIATLFIPPTFIVGVYGMNFDRKAGPLNMPELGWPYGYLFVWGVIIALAVGLLLYFKRKRWF